MILAGTYHNGTGAGKLTYIGGHSYPTSVPYANNVEAPYLHVFYNSLFFNGEAVAKVDLAYSPTTYPENGTDPLEVSIVNTGGSVATGVDNVSITLADGFTLPLDDVRPGPDRRRRQLLTWPGGLGDIAAGATAVTIQVAVDASVSGTAGDKAFGTLHSTYGDVFGEHFTGRPLPGDHRVAGSRPDAREDAADAGPGGDRHPGHLDAELRQHRRRAPPERHPRGHAADRLHVRLEQLVALAARSDRHPVRIGHDRALERRDHPCRHAGTRAR